MEIIFEELGIKFNLPNGVKLYNKQEVLKKLGYNAESQKYCLLTLGQEKTDWILLINHIGDCDTQKEYEELIVDYNNLNNRHGLKTLEREKLISEDGRALDYFVYDDGKNYTIIVFSFIQNKIFYSLTHCIKANKENSLCFSLKIMQNLFKK